jgi:hypothetical protein
MITKGPWMASEAYPLTKAHTIVNPQGRVIAAIVPSKDDATLICDVQEIISRLGPDTLAVLEDYKAGGTLHCTINIWDDLIARWQDVLAHFDKDEP